MNIDLQSKLEFGDQGALLTFLGDHAMAHQQYQSAIFTQRGVQIAGFDMAELGNPQEWALSHYQVHLAINNTLGFIEPSDLLGFDLQNKSAFYDWFLNHRFLHDATDKALGI